MPGPTELPDVVLRYLDAYNRMDVSGLVDCVADTIVFENVSNSAPPFRVEGKTAFAQVAAQAAEAFAIRRQAIRTAVIGESHVALELDWTGTPAVDVGDWTAGRAVALRGASFLTIVDGRLSKIVDLS